MVLQDSTAIAVWPAPASIARFGPGRASPRMAWAGGGLASGSMGSVRRRGACTSLISPQPRSRIGNSSNRRRAGGGTASSWEAVGIWHRPRRRAGRTRGVLAPHYPQAYAASGQPLSVGLSTASPSGGGNSCFSQEYLWRGPYHASRESCAADSLTVLCTGLFAV